MSNFDSVRAARSFARTQRFGLASLSTNSTGSTGQQEEAVRIAIAADGSLLLGNDVPVVAKRLQTTRVIAGTRDCYAVFEGQVELSGESELAHPWTSLHAGFEHKWRIEPDLVLWHCARRGPHAFLASEWLVAPSWTNEHQGIDHARELNRQQAALIEELAHSNGAAEARGAQIVSIDPDGLLLRAGRALLHIPFDAISSTAKDSHQALDRLLRSVAWRPMERRTQRSRGLAASENQTARGWRSGLASVAALVNPPSGTTPS